LIFHTSIPYDKTFPWVQIFNLFIITLKDKKGSTAMIAEQRKGVVIQDKGEQHKPRKLKQRQHKPELVSGQINFD
jgi:hypothetical protein